VTKTRLLITAGPTHEPIDGVRYLANRSSGRLGILMAGAAADLGASVTLLLGPTPLEPDRHPLLTTRRFRSTADLAALLETSWPDHDVLLMAAAVADFRPLGADSGNKIERGPDGLTLRLESTPDLLAGLADRSRSDQIRVGWALEVRESMMERARGKLARKRLDAIVANPLETVGSDRIAARLLVRGSGGPEEVTLPEETMSKEEFSRWLLARILAMHAERRNAGRSVDA